VTGAIAVTTGAPGVPVTSHSSTSSLVTACVKVTVIVERAVRFWVTPVIVPSW
jgi:hypothetical protein